MTPSPLERRTTVLAIEIVIHSNAVMRNRRGRISGTPESRPIPTRRKTIMKRLIALAVLMSTVLLSACNTVAGAGQDIQKGGAAITDKAEQHNSD
jgi:entericidin B